MEGNNSLLAAKGMQYQRKRTTTHHQQQSSSLFQQQRQLSSISQNRHNQTANGLPKTNNRMQPQFVSSPELRNIYYNKHISKNSQSPDKVPGKLLTKKEQRSPSTIRPSFSYFHLKRTEPSHSVAAMHMMAQRQLTGRFSTGIQSQAALLQDRPMSQQLKQLGANTEERRSRDQQQLNQQQQPQYQSYQKRLTMMGSNYNFPGAQEDVFHQFSLAGDIEDKEASSDSCEADADERESVKLSDDFDEESNPIHLRAGGGGLAPRNRYQNEQEQAWDYFPDGPKSSYESNLDEHDQDEAQHLSGYEITQQRHFQSSPILQHERMPRTDRVSRVSRLAFPGANICELLRSTQQDKPKFVKQNSKASLELPGKKSPAMRSARNTFYSPGERKPIIELNFFNDNQYTGNDGKKKTRLTFDHHLSPNKESFLFQSARAFPDRNNTRQPLFRKASDDSPQNHIGLSVQKLPQSRLSQRSLFGSRNRGESEQRINNNISPHMKIPNNINKIGAQQRSSYYQLQPRKKVIIQNKMAEQQNQNNSSNVYNPNTQAAYFEQQNNHKDSRQGHHQSSATAQQRQNQSAQRGSVREEVAQLAGPNYGRNTSGQGHLTPVGKVYSGDKTNSPISQSLINKNLVQIDDNYFDHMRLPETYSSNDIDQQVMKTPDASRHRHFDQLHLSEQIPSRHQYQPNSSFVNANSRHQGAVMSGYADHLDHITETANDKSVATSLMHRMNQMAASSENQTIQQFVPVYHNDESPSFKQLKNGSPDKPVYAARSSLMRSYADNGVDFRSSNHDDQSSNRNLISFLQLSKEGNSQDLPTASILTQQQNQINIQRLDANSHQSNQNSVKSQQLHGSSQQRSQHSVSRHESTSSIAAPNLTTPEKPIVPRAQYQRGTPTLQAQQAKMIAANKGYYPELEYGEEDEEGADGDKPAGAGGMTWLTSIGLSVSNLFTGGGDTSAQSEAQQSSAGVLEANASPVPPEQVIERRLSTNGEVPQDEENELAESIDIANVDVRNEEIRIHQGNTIRKKILFMENGATKKSSASKHRREGMNSLKASMRSAQSYNQIESGTDDEQIDEGSGSSAQDRLNDRENAISYTTSKDGSSLKEKINHINMSKGFKRQHSSSVHEQLNWASFQNLASHLLPSRKKNNDDDSSIIETDSQANASPNIKGSIQESQQAEDEAEVKSSRFGMLSALFDRVTKSTPKKLDVQSAAGDTEQEDMFQPHLEDNSPDIRGDRRKGVALNDKHESQGANRLFGRPASKTVHLEADRRPFLSQTRGVQQTQSEEKLRQIDNIVFNQDKSHFAIIWTDGGFTKFDVATLQIVQKVSRTPDPAKKSSAATGNMECDMAAEITFRQKMNQPKGEEGDQEDCEAQGEDEDEPVCELEQFKCVALQHKTKDYVVTLVRDPTTIVFVHVSQNNDKTKASTKPLLKTAKESQNRGYVKRKVQEQLGLRSHVKHFQEEVSQIEILPGARFTLICLKTSIYIYRKNSRDLFDIIPCSSPIISSSIYKSFEDKLVLAYLSKDDPGETVIVHDFSINASTQMDTIYTIAKPFSAGYKVGGIQLDELGQRITVVSADGCYIYLYCLEDQNEEQEGQDQAAPADATGEEHRIQEAALSDYPATASLFQHHQVTVKAPQQSFARSSSSCKDIYLPIQIVQGFTMQEHLCDFILLSSSSMTTHMFVLKNPDELEECQTQQKDAWTFSRVLPSSWTLERSKIRLNILEELTPVAPMGGMRGMDGRASVPLVPEMQGENVYKRTMQEYPYTCFVESSGLLVVISHSGYCCKFSIDLQHELPSLTDHRYHGFNSVRASRHSPRTLTRHNTVSLSQVDLGKSLALLKAKEPAIRKGSKQQQQRRQKMASPQLTLELNQTTGGPIGLAQSQVVLDDVAMQMNMQSQTSNNQNATSTQLKRAGAFSGYKQPTLRLKFKIQDFFIKIDQKADSLRRIRKRTLLQKRNIELKERALFLSKMQKQSTNKKTSKKQPKNALGKLLLGTQQSKQMQKYPLM